MLTLSKDMAKVLAANTRTRNADSAEVMEDLNGLRELAATILANEAGADLDVTTEGAIFLDAPTEQELASVNSKGTRSANRANRFKKAAGIAGLEEKTHYTVSRHEPVLSVVKERAAMTEEQRAELVPPYNMAPFGWVLVNFTEAGIKELGVWGTTQEKVADLVTAKLEEWYAAQSAPSAEEDPTVEEEENAPVVVEEPTPVRGKKAS